jgi:small-conductance mechanosensitive channel
MKSLHSFFGQQLFTIGDTAVTVATLTTGIAVIAGAYILSLLLQAAMRRGLASRGLTSDGSAGVLTRLLHYLLLLTGVAVALHTAGIELAALFAAGALFAVGIGFAMQNITQNFVSGMILMIERSIKPGDVLEVESRVVRVLVMGIRSTLVRTRDDEELIVPNSALAQSTVKNLTLKDSLYRLRVRVGVTYGSDLALVRSTLEQVGEVFEGRNRDKPPVVLLVDFGSSSVDYELSTWTNEPWKARVDSSRLREAIWWAFKEKRITIAFPQVDVHFDPPVTASLSGIRKAA